MTAGACTPRALYHPSSDMAFDSNDREPVTPREPPEGGHAAGLAYTVEITYREPGYAQRSGTDKPYGGRFVVRATDERHAIALAKAEFEAIAASSGVGWVRVIERIDCRRLSDVASTEPTAVTKPWWR